MTNKIQAMIYALGSAHWAISQNAFDAIIAAIVNSDHSDALKSGDENFLVLSDPRSIDGTWYAKKQESLGILEVHGPIIPYRTWYEGWLGFNSIESLSADFEVLKNDREIENVVVTYNTPGGDVDGLSEFASVFANSNKPVYSHIVGDAASGGYWLASQGQKITSVSTGRAGSIGAVSTIYDFKEAYEKKGIKTFDVVSAQSPRKRTDMTTEEGRSELQAMLNGIADVFIDDVARGRKTEKQNVMDNFGQGGMFIAQDAVDKGLVDNIMFTKDVIDQYNVQTSKNFFVSEQEDTNKMEGNKMSDSNVVVESNAITAADLEAAVKKENERIQSVEALKNKYEGKHPSVISAVAKEIDRVKFNSSLELKDIEMSLASVALDAMDSVVSKVRNDSSGLNEKLEQVPNTSDQEVKLSKDEKNRCDPKIVNGIAAGMKAFYNQE